MDTVAASLARSAAAREGIALSAWLSRAARREAVRTGAGPVRPVEQEALLDEQEREAAERRRREAG